MNRAESNSIKQDGFSLVELLVVISIIVVLMGIILGIYMSAKARRDEKKVQAELKAIEVAIHNFYSDASFFPPGDASDPRMNCLFKELTAGKKNYLEGTQMKNDGHGNLLAPVDHPDEKANIPYGSTTNYWCYNSNSPTNNPESYDLWVPVGRSGETVNMGNW